MKLGQSMSYNKKNTFLLKFAENEGGKLVLDLLFQKKKERKKSIIQVKASGLQLSFNIFRQPSAWYTIKKL